MVAALAVAAVAVLVCAEEASVPLRGGGVGGTWLDADTPGRGEQAGLVLPPLQPLVVPLITGGGRSATKSFQHWLRAIGVRAMHEGVHEEAITSSWLYAAGASDDPAARQALRKLPVSLDKRSDRARGVVFHPVVHIVRHPLDHVRSLAACLCGQ